MEDLLRNIVHFEPLEMGWFDLGGQIPTPQTTPTEVRKLHLLLVGIPTFWVNAFMISRSYFKI